MSTSGGSGGGNGLINIPVGVQLGTTIDLVEVGTENPTTAHTVTLDPTLSGTLIAARLLGDLFVRILAFGDPTSGWYFSDSTYDPNTEGPGFYIDGHQLTFFNHDGQGPIIFQGDGIDVAGDARVRGDLTVDGDLTVSGTINAESGFTIGAPSTFNALTTFNADTDYPTADTGPVVADTSDGHTYRLGTTAGVPVATLVT